MLGFAILVIALLALAALQTGAVVGAMYALHQRRPVHELLLRWAAILLPATLGYLTITWFLGDLTAGRVSLVLFLGALSCGIIGALNHVKPHVKNAIYGSLDFQNFTMAGLTEVLTRLAMIFFPVTLVLHVLEYVVIGRYIIKYPAPVYSGLFILEVAGIAAGLLFILELDRDRGIILTAVSAVFYLVALGFLRTFLA